MNSDRKRFLLSGLLVSAALIPTTLAAQEVVPATPPEFVATYDSLATAILANKQTEQNLVRSILSTTYAHADAAQARANRALQSGQPQQVQAALEELAGHVAQLGNEGDNAVAAVRKRLLEGGHHHHAAGESQGTYEPGYVIVTRSAKQKLLAASQNIARLSRKPDANALAQEWDNVKAIWNELSKPKQ